MRQYSTLDIRHYKWLGASLFLFSTLAAAVLMLGQLDRFSRANEVLRDQPFALAEALLRAHEQAHSLHTMLQDMVDSVDVSAAEIMLMHSEQHEQRLTEALTDVVQRNPDDSNSLAALFKALSDWRESRERVAELLIEGRWYDARFVHNTEGERRYRQLYAALTATLDAERSHAAHLRMKAMTAERSAALVILGLTVLAGGALATAGLGVVIFVRTHRPLTRLRTSLLALAAGDTSIAIPHCQSSSPVGAMARAIHRFRQSMIERDAATAALKLSEERLRQAVQDARRANDSKEQFLAAASHDLRQPLQALRLYLETLDRRLENQRDRAILTGALIALSAGEDLLRDYLDVSVLEAGIVAPTVTTMAIQPLLNDLACELSSAAASKGLDLCVVPSSAMVLSDAALLRRLLRNLITNAIRFTSDGRVLIGCRRHGNTLRIQVWDTGIGI
ncbi:MAG: HAMP domain-containing histidine kinase, partial [Magnetospirillum sp.]|nr:HAMP domain-containing histidine kinase [Magnetospirillum sp.]